MSLVITRDGEEFADRTWPYLEAAVERNVLATVLRTATQRGGFSSEPPLYAYYTDSQGQLTAAALRTPPWPLLAAGFADPDLAAELVHGWIQEDPEVPGVSAEPSTAQAICAAWSQQTGGFAHREFQEAMHVLSEVTPPARPARGNLRPATPNDRELLIEWDREFAIESRLGDGSSAERMVDRRLQYGLQMLWDDGGPVSTVGFNLTVAGTTRIGPVYTPPQKRNHGYATSAVAATSQMLLDRGAERCMLFTDLANPISNRIYAAIGYVRCGDWEQHGFHAAT